MTTSHALELESALLSDSPPQSERRAAAAGAERIAFEQVVGSEYGYVAGLVSRLLSWRSDVDDLVQDVFVSALSAWPRFRGQCTARTWLTRIALNKCRSFQRKAGLRARLLGAWRAVHHSEIARNDQPAAQDERYEEVRAALARLRQRDREVIVLYYLQQMSVADVAAMLNTSRNAVEVRLTRARQRLKMILYAEMEEGE